MAHLDVNLRVVLIYCIAINI